MHMYEMHMYGMHMYGMHMYEMHMSVCYREQAEDGAGVCAQYAKPQDPGPLWEPASHQAQYRPGVSAHAGEPDTRCQQHDLSVTR